MTLFKRTKGNFVSPTGAKILYSEYLKRKYLRYTLLLLIVNLTIFIILTALNVRLGTISVARKTTSDLQTMWTKNNTQMATDGLSLSQNLTVRRLLNTKAKPPTIYEDRAYQILYNSVHKWPHGSTFCLINRQGEIVATNLLSQNREQFRHSFAITDLSQKLNDDVLMSAKAMPIRLELKDKQTLSYLHAFPVAPLNQSATSHAFEGILFIGYGEESVAEFASTTKAGHIIITDTFQNMLYSSELSPQDPLDKYPSRKLQLRFQNSWLAWQHDKPHFYEKTTVGDIVIYTLIPLAAPLQAALYTLIMLAISAPFIAFCTMAIAKKEAKRQLTLVSNLLSGTREWAEGNLSFRLGESRFAEWTEIHNSFNTLFGKIDQLMSDNAELVSHRQHLELKQLERQFDPHFAFNVLEVLRYQIQIDPHSASEMVLAFSRLLRYSISFGHSQVQLASDIASLKDYLLLQKMRYNRRLEYSFIIPPELEYAKIPKLILQPLVENALAHGFGRKRTLNLSIEAYRRDNDLFLTVSDNGCGIDDGKLAWIRSALLGNKTMQKSATDLQTTSKSNQIGLYYVNRVIELLYGNRYGLTIDSVVDVSTTVTIHLPYREISGSTNEQEGI